MGMLGDFHGLTCPIWHRQLVYHDREKACHDREMVGLYVEMGGPYQERAGPYMELVHDLTDNGGNSHHENHHNVEKSPDHSQEDFSYRQIEVFAISQNYWPHPEHAVFHMGSDIWRGLKYY